MTLWYGSIYLLFMFIYYGASSEWVYWVLDWDRPSALALYALLPLLLFAAHVVWCATATHELNAHAHYASLISTTQCMRTLTAQAARQLDCPALSLSFPSC